MELSFNSKPRHKVSLCDDVFSYFELEKEPVGKTNLTEDDILALNNYHICERNPDEEFQLLLDGIPEYGSYYIQNCITYYPVVRGRIIGGSDNVTADNFHDELISTTCSNIVKHSYLIYEQSRVLLSQFKSLGLISEETSYFDLENTVKCPIKTIIWNEIAKSLPEEPRLSKYGAGIVSDKELLLKLQTDEKFNDKMTSLNIAMDSHIYDVLRKNRRNIRDFIRRIRDSIIKCWELPETPDPRLKNARKRTIEALTDKSSITAMNDKAQTTPNAISLENVCFDDISEITNNGDTKVNNEDENIVLQPTETDNNEGENIVEQPTETDNNQDEIIVEQPAETNNNEDENIVEQPAEIDNNEDENIVLRSYILTHPVKLNKHRWGTSSELNSDCSDEDPDATNNEVNEIEKNDEPNVNETTMDEQNNIDEQEHNTTNTRIKRINLSDEENEEVEENEEDQNEDFGDLEKYENFEGQKHFWLGRRSSCQNHDGFDLYETDPKWVEALLKFFPALVEKYKHERIWEPCVGLHKQIANTLKANGFTNIYESDIAHEPEHIHDFLLDEVVSCRFIITNPPFNKKYDFLKKMFNEVISFAVLLPVDMMFTAKFFKLIEEHAPCYEINLCFVCPQPSFTHDGTKKQVSRCVWLICEFDTALHNQKNDIQGVGNFFARCVNI